MSGIYSAIISNTQSLNFHSKSVETAGRNLANVNNPDYARQRLNAAERKTIMLADGPQSQGVEIGSLEALRDKLLDREVQREISRGGRLEVLSSTYRQLEISLGERYLATADSGSISGSSDVTTEAGSLSARIDSFFNAWHELSNDPSNSSLREVLLNKTDGLTEHLQMLDTRFDDYAATIDDRISQEADNANRLINQVHAINEQMARLRHEKAGATVNLENEREVALDKLAKLMDIEIETIPDTGGQVRVLAEDTGGSPVALVDGNQVSGGLTFTGTSIEVDGTELNIRQGELAGYLEARTGAIPDVRGRMDDLAAQIITSVNAAYDPSSIHGAFFTGTDAGTIARDPAITANTLATSDNPANEGDNTNALAIAQLAEQSFSTPGDAIDGTFNGFVARVTADVGESVLQAEQSYENQQVVEDALRTEQASVRGVSMDEETADLMRFERAFQGTARVINVLDSMLDTIVNGLVR